MLDERLLSVEEVASRIGQAPVTIRRKIARGEMPGLRVGLGPRAPLRVPEQELEAWLYQDSRMTAMGVRDGGGPRYVARPLSTLAGGGTMTIRDAVVASALGELTPLQQRILSAYEHGRYDELRRLQAEYRATAVSSSASRYGAARPVRLVEPRTTSTRPRRRATRPSWKLGDAETASTGVSISAAAGEEIEEFIWAMRATSWEGIESALWLSGEGLQVSAVVPATGERGRAFVEMNYQDTREHAERLRLPLLGDLHLHPYGDPEPSDGDRAGWREAFRLLGREYVGVIAASADQTWIHPQLAAWCTYGRDGRTVVDLVSLKGA